MTPPKPRGSAQPPSVTPRDGSAAAASGFVTFEGQAFYRIASLQHMRPFLMSLTSDTDLWMFVTSGGGLTAGRRDPDGALFSYETVDKLHDAHAHTGPITLVRVQGARGPEQLWQPFADPGSDDGRIERNLYKNALGTQLVFEEIRRDLALAFRYRWAGSDAFGWVRTATLENLGDTSIALDLLDGLRDVLPNGVPLALYQHSSSLVDAYKRADLDPELPLATFSLSAKIVDRAEASEQLRANTVWLTGLDDATLTLSLDAVAAFRRGEHMASEPVLTGRRGNFLAVAALTLAPHERKRWHVAADAAQSHVDVARTRERLRGGSDLDRAIEASLREADENLLRIVGGSDGIQCTADVVATAHHLASVLFNDMRGGVFDRHHDVPSADLRLFLHQRNRPLAAQHAGRLEALPDAIGVSELLALVDGWGEPQLVRLCHEYLPLYFGRRHGDPSRPWNRFSIRVRNAEGGRALSYEGNWRDVFQNWEALAHSFPAFLPNLVARFVNASTVDGFNPYRVSRDGIDWEVPDPHEPWSNIGYWGDHQAVYLLRLLEAHERFAPGELTRALPRAIFSYADVPYRLQPYAALVADPHHTIEYDLPHAKRIAARVEACGSDGRFVPDADGHVLQVTLFEKLLVPALAKLSNFVPDGGIWMNTQRPEWNDANNALVGYGVSVVTLFHLRRYLAFVGWLLAESTETSLPVSGAVVTWLRGVHEVLRAERPARDLESRDARDRKRILDALGTVFSDYRARVYAEGVGATRPLALGEARELLMLALEHVDHTLRAMRRGDGLYHSYQLLAFTRDGEGATLRPLEEMLEGQVAALASGLVPVDEAAELVERMFESPLYRADQASFMLYPEKSLPGFMDKNRLQPEAASRVGLLGDLLSAGERSVLEHDAAGVLRFQADFRHAGDVGAAMDRLAREARWSAAVARDRQAVLDEFENVFHHHAFTGRSGSMYAFEGIGSIYWHMVAKLLLALRENVRDAMDGGVASGVLERLVSAYDHVRAGLGFTKTAAQYGAFPADPYSHTPRHAGAQQPGMTGQVKEEILTRLGELGVEVEAGCLRFRPVLLHASEFLEVRSEYRLPDLSGSFRSHVVPAGGLAFSICQVPVVYTRVAGNISIRVTARDGTERKIVGGTLDLATSRAVFARSGEVARIDVAVPDRALRPGLG